MDNVYNETGAEIVYQTLANNTRAELSANFGPCKMGVETDRGTIGFTDHLGAYRSLSVEGHTHDDRYYTESEIDTLLSGIQAPSVLFSPDGETEAVVTDNDGNIVVAGTINGFEMHGQNTDTQLVNGANAIVKVIDGTNVGIGYASGNYTAVLHAGTSGQTWIRPGGAASFPTARGILLNPITGSDPGSDLLTLDENESVFPRSVSCASKVKMTPEGGIAIRLTNKTGGASVKGYIVQPGGTCQTDDSFIKCVVDVPNPIGVVYEDGIADGSECWVVVSGIAEVYYIGNVTRGYLARGFITGDAGYVAGQALAEAVPSSPFATDKHFYEIGHPIQSRTGAGLARTVLHFN